VTGSGTLWAVTVSPGDEFTICDANALPTGGRYEVATVNSNTSITLVQNYQGSTASGLAYAVMNMAGNQSVPQFSNRLSQFFDKQQTTLNAPGVNVIKVGGTTFSPDAVARQLELIAGTGVTLTPSAVGKNVTVAGTAASEAGPGVVELATTAETQAGTDTTRAVTPSGLAAWPRTGSVTVTVGPTGCDYTTLNAAISALCKRYPGHGATAVINVSLDFVMAEQVLVRGQNLGWITVAGGADSTTPRTIQTSAITQPLDGHTGSVRPVFGACLGGVLPTIVVPFAMDATTALSNVCGLSVMSGGRATMLRGIVGASTIASGIGAIVSGGSGAYLGGDWTGWPGGGVLVSGGSRAFVLGNFRTGASNASTDIQVSGGGIISVHAAAVGGISQAKNAITASGIILDPRA
jgi:hypothetical protein